MRLNSMFGRLIAAFVGAFLGLLIAFLCYSFVFGLKIKNQSTNAYNDLLLITQNTIKVLDELNNASYPACSDSALLMMRKAQFKSANIKDIGYIVNNQLICTTGIGLLDTPFEISKPDIVFNEVEYSFLTKLVTFDFNVTGGIIRKGQFNAVLTFSSLLHKQLTGSRIEVTTKIDDQVNHIFGTYDLYDTKYIKGREYLVRDIQFHTYSTCGKEGFVCVTVKHINFSGLSSGMFVLFVFLIIMISVLISVNLFNALYKYIQSKRRRIKHGLKNDNFIPYYQPIVNLQTGMVIGCEILARYSDKLGAIYPDVFIPIVAQKNMSWQLTEQLIKKVINDFNSLESPILSFYLSINIFPRDITNGNVLKAIDLFKNVSSKLQVNFEITEDESLDFKKASSIIHQLYENGFKISIDDFGTGYSNLMQLKLLEISTLKIDKSFIDDVETGSIRSTLIPNIISIADKLDAEVIAEGIENLFQVNTLLSMGIKYGQGWVFAKAMPFNSFCEYLIDNSELIKKGQ